MSNAPPPKLNLRRLESLQRLLQYGAAAVLLVFIGLTAVSGYKLLQINREIGDKQQKLLSLNGTLQQQEERSFKVSLAIQDAEAKLEKTQKEVASALAKLEAIETSRLPANARAAIEDTVSRIRGAGKTVSETRAELVTANEAPPPGSGGGSRQTLIRDLFSEKPSIRINAYKSLMANSNRDPALVPELLSFARSHTDNPNGIYNSLVLLSHLNKEQLKPYAAEISAFARDLKPMGPRIEDRVNKLVDRLPN